MKRIIPLFAIISLIACNQASVKTASENSDSTNNHVNYPYQAEYSSDIKIGDVNHSKIILDFFKKWEENKIDDMRAMLTDSVSVEFADGTHLNITSDSLIKTAKQVRAGYSSVKFVVEGWMPIHVNDKNDDFVLLWDKEYTVDVKGKADSSRSHSYWQLKNDKISHWSEFMQKMTPPMEK